MPSSSQSSIFPKGSKQSVHSVTSFRFTQSASIRRQAPHSSSLPSAPFRSFVHTLFAFTSGLARGPLSKLAGKQCKHRQPSRCVHLLRSSTTLCGLPVSAGGHFHKGTFFAIRKHRILKIQLLLAVSVSTPFVLAAKHFLVLQVGT